MPNAEDLRESVISCARRMRSEGLVVGTSGNVSGRERDSAEFWVTPSGVDYEAMSVDDLVRVDIAGGSQAYSPSPLAGEGRGGGFLRPSTDTPNHLAIYRARADVCGIVHTHSTYATVFAVLRREIPPLLVEAAGYLGGAVPVLEYLPGAPPGSAERVASGLGSGPAALLPNHGVIAVGESAQSALTAALLVEHAARVAYLARLAGEPFEVPPDEIERMYRFLNEEYGQ